MAESRLKGLAGKMKTLIDAEEQRRTRERDEAEKARAVRREFEERVARRKESARAARGALMDDLAGFSEAIGHLTAKKDEEGLTLGYRGRAVRFEPDGDEDRIAIRLEGDVITRNHHFGWDGQTWEVVFDHGTTVVRFDLEAGLEEILREQLHVPLPGASPVPVSAAPPVADGGASAPASEGEGEGKKKKGKGTPGSNVKELKGRLA